MADGVNAYDTLRIFVVEELSGDYVDLNNGREYTILPELHMGDKPFKVRDKESREEKLCSMMDMTSLRRI